MVFGEGRIVSLKQKCTNSNGIYKILGQNIVQIFMDTSYEVLIRRQLAITISMVSGINIRKFL